MGLFHDRSLVFLHDMAISGLVAQISAIAADGDPGHYLQNVMAFVSRPLHTVHNSAFGSAWLERWYANPNTLSPCSDEKDDAERNLYKNETKCAGQNFESFREGGNKTLYENVASCYDAVYAFAHAMHTVLYEEKLSLENLEEDHSIVMKAFLDVSFEGITGLVGIFV
jgi:Receptor family ligand binding region